MTTLLIDNYDSFTYNLYQYFAELGAEVIVRRNDQLTIDEIREMAPDHIVISPGPGDPTEAGISREVIREFGGKVPVLGVCLGHQCIYDVYGGDVTGAGEIKHGKASVIHHDGKGVFAGVPQDFHAVRYHSLAGTPGSQPPALEVTATSETGIIMGVRHRELIVEGVQFHPESIGTEHGKVMVGNFLQMEGGRW
ncbi:MAG: aminodeoxychorismate/anthranilate synthase component II [Dehalococcoidia bacterium]|nr:aminodeoxychorismate/anthranilate synthase component II [Dehalococcoidia bacterium]